MLRNGTRESGHDLRRRRRPLRPHALPPLRRSGLKLPAISLGLWQNFGDDRPIDTQRAILRRAFDLGITHFDLANNYGPPYGSAEKNFGASWPRTCARTATSSSSRPRRATTCGRAPTANGARASTCSPASTRACGAWASTTSTSSTPIASTPTRRSRRRWAPSTPRCARARLSMPASRRTRPAHRRGGRDPARPRHAAAHPPAAYSLLNRWIEPDLLDVLGSEGVGAIVFSPLAQGCSPTATSTASRGLARRPRRFAVEDDAQRENLERVRALNEIASGAGRPSRSSPWPGRCATRA